MDDRPRRAHSRLDVDTDGLGFVMLFLGAVTALPTLVLLYFTLTDDGALARFHATPRQPIRGARSGDALKIAGVAAALEPLVGPFTGRDAVWYALVVTETERSFDGTHLRERVTRHLAEQSRAPFVVTDDSGTSARIVVDGEELLPNVTSETFEPPLPARVRQALEARGIPTRAKGGEPRHLVCIERAIAPADPVVAIGPARRVTSGSGEATSYRDAPTELVLGERAASGARMFVLTNRPERELGAGERRLTQITWALAASTLALLGGGAWLFFG